MFCFVGEQVEPFLCDGNGRMMEWDGKGRVCLERGKIINKFC